MRQVVRIDQAKTDRLLAEALPLLTPAASELVAEVRVFVTDCRRGRANWRESLVRVPAWVFKERVNFAGKGLIEGGAGFAAYYLAHELAHVKATTDAHNDRFMEAFKELCPPSLRWYETIYKPKRAAAAGIVRCGSGGD